MKFNNDCDIIFMFQNKIEHKYSWNMCVPNECSKNGAVCPTNFTGSQTKTAFIQYVRVLQQSNPQSVMKVMSPQKNC